MICLVADWRKMMDKRVNKKTGEELQMFFHFKRRGGKSKIKKGKGSYSRKEFKNFKNEE